MAGGHLIRLTAVLCGLLLLAACGAARGELVENGFTAPADTDVELAFVDESEFNSPLAGWETTRLAADAPGVEAFGFDATELRSGSNIEGGVLFEQRPLIISFVTPTCPICSVEAPKLAFAAEQNPDITYVMVHNGSVDTDYLDFLQATGIDDGNIVHLVDGDVSLWAHFGVLQQPSYVFVDADGIVTSSIGALEDHGLERAAEEIFGQTAS
jgi:thiol-disulfide isomerase/thioredoxin